MLHKPCKINIQPNDNPPDLATLPTITAGQALAAMHAGSDPFQALEMSRGAAVRIDRGSFHQFQRLAKTFRGLCRKYGYQVGKVLLQIPQTPEEKKQFGAAPFFLVMVTPIQ